MLSELHISNLAVIADAAMEFAPGLNVLTGPTGAGKSLVIGAIEILLGLRSPAKVLRADQAEGRITGVFLLQDRALRDEIGEILDAPLDGDELHLVRRILASGRSTASANGNPIAAATLRRIGERLIDIHGQHDQQYLLKPANQLTTLDEFADAQTLRAEATGRYAVWRECLSRRDALRAAAQQRRDRLDLLEFHARQIDDAAPTPDELERVEARHKLLSQLAHVQEVLASACAELTEGDAALADRLAGVSTRIEHLGQLDPSLAPIAAALRSAAASAREAGRDLQKHLDALDADPGELPTLDQRLGILRRLTARHGPTLADVLAYRAQIEDEMRRLRHDDAASTGADDAVKRAESEYSDAAARLSRKRSAAVKRFVPAVNDQMRELGLDRAVFDIDLRSADASSSGSDSVEFMLRSNPGQPLLPLREIASGGEMNRMMLALKSVSAGAGPCSVLVFDEVDANVGGRMGAVIGRKLRALAREQQVLCITHLPQIAAFADRHLRVEKTATQTQTQTRIDVLSGDDRIEELAEMIAGSRVSDTTRAQARDLLSVAKSGATRRR